MPARANVPPRSSACRAGGTSSPAGAKRIAPWSLAGGASVAPPTQAAPSSRASARWEASHRALARELGAAWVGGATDAPPAKLHGAILFAPAGELVPPALQALERGGTLALAGIHMGAVPSLDYDREVFGERVIRSV